MQTKFKLAALLFVMVCFLVTGCTETSKLEKETDTSITCGTYDSRAVAVAFVGSEIYKATTGKQMNEMMVEYKKAEAAGDEQKIKKLNIWGKDRQALLHKQGFSTAPVDDILEHINTQLPAIKKRTGVDIIVSKWDTQMLAKYKSAKQVDITMLLIEAFKPNARQKRSAIEIQKYDPVPLEKMINHKH